MPYFGHLSGRLFFNKISRKYKAETNYPITAKVRAKTAKALIERERQGPKAQEQNHQHFNILNLYRGKITVLEKICRPVAAG